jgi:hypothetical protein
LLNRAGVGRDRILLTDWRSTDWQSLLLTGERHQIRLRVPAPGAREVAAMITDGVEDAEFSIPGQIVADISITGPAQARSDGSVEVAMEALTISE